MVYLQVIYSTYCGHHYIIWSTKPETEKESKAQSVFVRAGRCICGVNETRRSYRAAKLQIWVMILCGLFQITSVLI